MIFIVIVITIVFSGAILLLGLLGRRIDRQRDEASQGHH